MDVSAPQDSFRMKRALFPLGLLLLLLAVFSVMDLAWPSNRGTTAVATPDDAPAPMRPKLYRKGETTIVIESGFFHRSSFRYGGNTGKKEADALFVCLSAGVDEVFGPEEAPLNPFEGMERRTHVWQMRQRVEEIKDQCLKELTFDAEAVAPQ
jgi:hypothetical protein